MSVIVKILTNNNSNKAMSKTFISCVLLPAAFVLSGCAGISFNTNYKRWTYDLLRQEDCRQNDPGSFCSRTFVFEYDEYEIVRQDFLRAGNITRNNSNNRYGAVDQSDGTDRYAAADNHDTTKSEPRYSEPHSARPSF